jgi:hypothetical protein
VKVVAGGVKGKIGSREFKKVTFTTADFIVSLPAASEIFSVMK